ncbi:MAG: serine hydrolase domain-containing protein [Hyphomonadaceae bacterium]
MKRLMATAIVIASVIFVALFPGAARADEVRDRIAAYLEPYVSSGNFSGSIMVVQSGRVVFRNSYGFSDIAAGSRNRANTKYHIASLSMQFTAAAVMRLVEQGRLSLDAKVSEFVADIPNGDRITIRHLLQQNSGVPDRNDLDGYDDLLNEHQTPESLVQFIRGHPPRFEPGGETQGEEHSAYDILALIIERVTGLSFREAVRREVFAPLRMSDSGIDDDSPIGRRVAVGHVENGPVALQPASVIHWSAKVGTGSAYSTINDERRWLQGFFGDSFLSASNRQMMLDNGYGWERDDEDGETTYFQNGEGPGFASTMIYLPRLNAAIVVLSNFQIPVAGRIAWDIAALLQGKEYRQLELRASPLTAEEIAHVTGSYTFGSNFYRANGTLQLVADGDGLMLRWPGWGPNSPVIVVDDHHFIDRHYWTRFSIADDESGQASQLVFGRFTGQRSVEGDAGAAH